MARCLIIVPGTRARARGNGGYPDSSFDAEDRSERSNGDAAVNGGGGRSQRSLLFHSALSRVPGRWPAVAPENKHASKQARKKASNYDRKEKSN